MTLAPVKSRRPLLVPALQVECCRECGRPPGPPPDGCGAIVTAVGPASLPLSRTASFRERPARLARGRYRSMHMAVTLP